MSVFAFVMAHKVEILAALGLLHQLVSVVVAMLPQSTAKSAFVAMMERLSFLTMKDSPGTLKLPMSSAVDPASMREPAPLVVLPAPQPNDPSER